MTIIVANSVAANPAAPYAGWSKPAAARDVQVFTTGGVWVFRKSSGTANQMAIWVDNIDYTGNTLVAKFTHGANATQGGNDSARVCFLNSSGDGYTLWINQAGTEARIYKVIACNLDTTQIATFTGYGTGYSQLFELRCPDKSTGTFQFWRNGVQIGSDVVDTTYTSLTKIGFGVNNGNIIGMEASALFTASTLSNPVVSGQPFSGTSLGAADGAGTIATGGQTVAITFAGGGTTYSGTWPALTDGIVYPPMNGVSRTFTVAQSSSSSTIDSVFEPPADFVNVVLGVLITDPAYLASVYTLEPDWAIVYDETQLGGMTIYPDSRVDFTNYGTFVCWVHRLGDGNDLVRLTVTVSSGGLVVSGLRGNTLLGNSLIGKTLQGNTL